jgi:hypothetical protein
MIEKVNLKYVEEENSKVDAWTSNWERGMENQD